MVDGKPYRFLGPQPADAPTLDQKSMVVQPTRSIYQFEGAGIELTLTFMTPLLVDDLDVLSRPASYIEFQVRAVDGAKHNVALYLDITGEWVTNTNDQQVVWGCARLDGETPLSLLRIGSLDQPVLDKVGDNLRIDWGYLYLVYPDTDNNRGVITDGEDSREMFALEGSIPLSDDLRMPRMVRDNWPVMACTMKLGEVGIEPVFRLVTLVYDDLFSVEYFHRKMKGYWQRNGMTIDELIRAAVNDYSELKRRCEDFDRELMMDAEKIGGCDYADIISVSYRQAIAAHKLVADLDGRAFFFSKENFSNGCMATVDVAYPSSPMFLLFNTKLLRGMLEPILEYSSTHMWPYDFAPHDLGTYPKANGQVYGREDKGIKFQMPVEESGNMLIMLAAMAYRDGHADLAKDYWDVITRWAEYLKSKGLDPENQLCTDDFSGHLAHNTNLSLKAITGIACYSFLADMLGKKETAKEYSKLAEEMAAEWPKMASDGDHYRLAFDQPGTWSLKYNLLWDKILGLQLFDPKIAQTEVEHYKKVQNTYGLPLDSREKHTKADWVMWAATLADKESDFRSIVASLRRYLHESESRVPFSDWYWTTDGKMVAWMRARSVVGAMFVKMLTDRKLWDKWSKRAK